ncbi:hypothetical protein OSB04_032206 [Centaurea solstitialis]|uniref:Mitochondrial protein n=1 Tax=Centaurea solstitialis TaxID=347529 RepID=A0AA38SBW5_9ASTR|nr:hypothetical protein OSB04_032206 [Centaurea solstitialis]
MPLKDGNQGISFKPYNKYPFIQQDLTDKLTRRWLEQGMVRHVNNSFASTMAFQSLMNHVFNTSLRNFVLVFFDGILVYNPSPEAHMQQLKMVLEISRQNALYLGHIISKQGVATDQSKIIVVQGWPLPRNLTQLRGFLGMMSYYFRFVKGYGKIAKHLTQLLKYDDFYWTTEATDAFHTLKGCHNTTSISIFHSRSKLMHRLCIPGLDSESESNSEVVKPYHTYSPSGLAYGKAVYVHHSREEDYRALTSNGVGVAKRGGGMSRNARNENGCEPPI